MEDLTVGTRVDHPRYGEGIISKNNLTAYEIFFERGGKIEITKRNTDLSVIKKNEDAPKSGISVKELEKVITYVLGSIRSFIRNCAARRKVDQGEQ